MIRDIEAEKPEHRPGAHPQDIGHPWYIRRCDYTSDVLSISTPESRYVFGVFITTCAAFSNAEPFTRRAVRFLMSKIVATSGVRTVTYILMSCR